MTRVQRRTTALRTEQHNGSGQGAPTSCRRISPGEFAARDGLALRPIPRSRHANGSCIVLAVALYVTAALVAGASTNAFDRAAIVRTVVPFLKQHCSDCHGSEDPEAGFSVTSLKTDIHAGEDLRAWTQIARRLKVGDMPPEDQPQPDPQQVASVVATIRAALDAAGAGGVVDPGSLETANQVDHDLLFNTSWTAPLYAPPRVWRLSNEIYLQWADDVTAGAVFKGVAGKRISRPFSIPPGDGFTYLANSRGIDEATAAQLFRNAEQLVLEQTKATVEKTRGAKRTPAEFVPLLTATELPPRPLIEKAIRKQFQLALHREPTAEELTEYTKLFRTNFDTAGAVIGTRATLMAILLHPEALYRFEIGDPAAASALPARDGASPAAVPLRVRPLTPREIVFAIAYALTDEPPSASLLKLADTGQLRTAQDVAALVRQMLEDPKLRKPRILRFFQEYFGYTRATDVFKDKKPFPAFRAEMLVDDTNRLVEHVLQRDRWVFETLLTTNESFVVYTATEGAQKRIRQIIADFEKKKRKDPAKYASARPRIAGRQHFLMYNLDDFVPPPKQPTRLPADQRAGILTQPSWLVAFSGNTDNDPVRRGKWVRERLLGGTVPDLPISVNAQLSDAADGHHSRCWEWPCVLIGHLGGRLKCGRYMEWPPHGANGHRHIGNLYTTFLQAVGDSRESFGQPDPLLAQDVDERGPLSQLLV